MRVRTGVLCTLGAAGLMVAGMALADGTTTNSAVPKGSVEITGTLESTTDGWVSTTFEGKKITFQNAYGQAGYKFGTADQIDIDAKDIESVSAVFEDNFKFAIMLTYVKSDGKEVKGSEDWTADGSGTSKTSKLKDKPDEAGVKISGVQVKCEIKTITTDASTYESHTLKAFYYTPKAVVTYDKTSVDGKEYAGGTKVAVPTVTIKRGTDDVTTDWTITYMLDGEAVELDNEKKVTLPNQAGAVKLSWKAEEKANADNKLASTTAQEATLNVVALKLKTKAQSVVVSSNVDLEAVVEPSSASGYDIAFYRVKQDAETEDQKLGDADATTGKYAWSVGADAKDFTVYAKATKTNAPPLTSDKITVKVKAAASSTNKGSQTIEWTIPADKLFAKGATLAEVLTACPATLVLDPEDASVNDRDIAYYKPGATADAPVLITNTSAEVFSIEAGKEDAEYTVIAKKAAIGDTYTAAADVTVTIKVSKPVTSVKFPDDFAPAATAAYADIAKAKVYEADGSTEVSSPDIKYYVGETEITSTTPAGWKLGGGKQTITAKYAGDATHHSSEGSAQVTNRYPKGTAGDADVTGVYNFEASGKGDINTFAGSNGMPAAGSLVTTGGANSTSQCVKFANTGTGNNYDVQPGITLPKDLNGQTVVVEYYAKASVADFDITCEFVDPEVGWNSHVSGTPQKLTTEWQKFKDVVKIDMDESKTKVGMVRWQWYTNNKAGDVFFDEINFRASTVLDKVDDAEHGLKNFDELPMKITGSTLGADGNYAKEWWSPDNQKWYGSAAKNNGVGRDLRDYDQLIITFAEEVNPAGKYVVQYDIDPERNDVFNFNDSKYISADGKVLTIPLDGELKIAQCGGAGPEDMEIAKVQLHIRPQAQVVTWTAADDAEDDGLEGTSNGATPAVWTAKLPTKDVAHTGPATCTVKYYIDNVEATPGTDNEKSLTLTGLGVHYVKFVSTPPDYTAANNPENKVYWATATEVYTINVTDPAASEQVIEWDDEEVELMAQTAFAAEGGTPAAPLYKTAKSMTTATPAAATGNAVTYKYTTVESFDADVFDPSAATWTAVPADFKFPAGLTLVMAECAASEADNTASPTKPAYNAAVPAFRLFSATKYKSQVKWTDTDIAAKLDSTSGVYKGVEGLTAPAAGVAEKIVTAATDTTAAQVEAIANATVTIKFYSCDAQYNLDDDATALTLTGGKLPAKGASAQYILAVVTFAGDDCCEASEAQYKLSIEAASALNVVNAAADVVGVEYYNLEGQKVNANAKGLLLRVEKLSNGKTNATKVLVK